MVASIYIESMDWFLVGTVPVHEVFAELDAVAQRMMLTTLAVAAIFIFMGIFLANSIAMPINQIAKRFTDLGRGDGDLSQRIEVKGNDEIAQLSKGFNGFIEKIHQSIKDVAQTSRELQVAAEGVSRKALVTHDNSQQQRDQTIQVVTAINQMGRRSVKSPLMRRLRPKRRIKRLVMRIKGVMSSIKPKRRSAA